MGQQTASCILRVRERLAAKCPDADGQAQILYALHRLSLRVVTAQANKAPASFAWRLYQAKSWRSLPWLVVASVVVLVCLVPLISSIAIDATSGGVKPWAVVAMLLSVVVASSSMLCAVRILVSVWAACKFYCCR